MTAAILKFESSSSGLPKCVVCGKPATQQIQLMNVDTNARAGSKWFCGDCNPDRSLTPAIASELHAALERLDAPPDLLSIIGSYGDTLSNEEVLEHLKSWNRTGEVLNERQ